MPSFMDKLGSAATAAKWKADQQMRIMRTQNSIHDLENQVKAQTTALGNTALALFAQGSLTEDALREICSAIGRLNEQIAQQTDTLHHIQSEQAPSEGQPQGAVTVPAAPPAPAPMPAPVVEPAPEVVAQPVVLVCPQCGQVLVGRFCPEHGVAGVPRS
jgi:hypothetical protein